MTKAPTPAEMSKGQSDNTNNATKSSITVVADRLRTASWSKYGQPAGVVNRFTGPTFQLPASVVKSKGNTFKNL